MTIRRCLRGVIVCVVVVGTIVVARPARAQSVTITVTSGDALLAQLRAVAKLAGAEAARPVLDALDGLDKGGTLKWLDRTKPVTATGDMDPNTGQPVVNVFLPITSRDDLLDAIGDDVDFGPGLCRLDSSRDPFRMRNNDLQPPLDLIEPDRILAHSNSAVA